MKFKVGDFIRADEMSPKTCLEIVEISHKYKYYKLKKHTLSRTMMMNGEYDEDSLANFYLVPPVLKEAFFV